MSEPRDSTGREPMRCPFCGLTAEEHTTAQEAANKVRASVGLPPLSAPDIVTGFQKRTNDLSDPGWSIVDLD
jgi:hypothetical protein